MRLFTAILLPLEVRAHLRVATNRLFHNVFEHEVKLTHLDNLHVTLNFFDEVADDRVTDWRERLAGVRFGAATVFADQLLFLPPRGPVRVVAAGLGGEVAALADLQARIVSVASELGVPPEERAYTPHITVGRNRRGRYQKVASFLRKDHEQRTAGHWPGPTCRVENFALVQSTLKPHGPEYRIIATFPAA